MLLPQPLPRLLQLLDATLVVALDEDEQEQALLLLLEQEMLELVPLQRLLPVQRERVVSPRNPRNGCSPY